MSLVLKSGAETFYVKEWSKELGEEVEHALKPGEFFQHAFDSMEVEQGATLLDFFVSILHLEDDEISVLSQIAACNIGAFAAEILNEPKKKSDLDYLRVAACLNVEGNFKDPASPPEAHVYVDFGGYGKGDDGNGGVYEGNYSVSFTPLNELRHLELRLEDVVSLSYWKWDKAEGEESWGELVPKVKYSVTALEFCRSILWEVSFYGGPKSRDEIGDDLREVSKRISEGTEPLYLLNGFDENGNPRWVPDNDAARQFDKEKGKDE